MIAALFWIAQTVVKPVVPISARPATVNGSSLPAELPPAVVLQHYAAAVRKVHEPRVVSFDYTLEQTGPRTLMQTHLVFRAGSDERDETVTVDGKRLSPPKVRIFRGRRNRYTIALLAPRQADYTFTYVGARKDVRHLDYIFRLSPRVRRQFMITDVTIDGVRFLPLAIDFATAANAGIGSVAFGSNARWWVPYVATARATVASAPATERLTFYTYRFPPTLPPSTFTQARRPAIVPKPVFPLHPQQQAPRVPSGLR